MEEPLFSENDITFMKARGIEPERALEQIETFKKEAPYLKLIRPCTLRDGITALPQEELKNYETVFDQMPAIMTSSVFVPASGAASRMFKVLLKFYNKNVPEFPIENDAKKPNQDIQFFLSFLNNVEKFAFYKDLASCVAHKGVKLNELDDRPGAETILDCLLSEKGLDYSNLPKGLVKFHSYPQGARTAFEEHLVEASGYCTDQEGVCRLHFTVSPKHRKRFTSIFQEIRHDFERKLGVQFQVEFSVQHESTDTLAVDLEDRPFRLEDGSLHFRPGGHGALIENLGNVSGDIIFIKNIDNIVPDRLRHEILLWKKVLGGVFILMQERIFSYLEKLASGLLNEESINEMEEFSKSHLNLPHSLQPGSGSVKQRQDRLFNNLNRPLRVCGMVKNLGEPGGGPFWVESEKGTASLQIIEKVQVDPDSEDQQRILSSSTHFNPVDMVCGIKDFQGKRFDLKKYVDHNAVFISRKSKNGRELKALELPGLWNGAMAHWNTIFIETPLITFNPVKTVNDLLRDEHR